MAARKNPLRVANETDVPSPPKSVTEAASHGTTRELLVAMRDRVAVAVEDSDTAARDLAALTRRLREITRDIEALDAKESGEASNAYVEDGKFNAEAI